MKETKTTVSIVIRAYNEAAYLPALLEAIDRQTLTPDVVVLVDSGSTDATVDIARRYGCSIVQINSKDFTFGYSLNVGIRAAETDIAAIVSAHTEPVDTFWLEKLIEPFDDESVAMVYGKQVGVASSKIGEYFDFQRTYGKTRLDHVFANNANSAIRRTLWAQRPFDEAILGLEDIEWSQYWVGRGFRTSYAPEAGVYHIHTEKWAQVWRRYYRESVSATTIRYWRKRLAPVFFLSETGRALRDLYYVYRQGDRTAVKGGFFSTMREIVLFRTIKGTATIAGLFGTVDLRDPSTRHQLFFDRQIRCWQYTQGRFVQTLVTPELLRPNNVAVVALRVADPGEGSKEDLLVFGQVVEAGAKVPEGGEYIGRYVAFHRSASSGIENNGSPSLSETDQISCEEILSSGASLEEVISRWVFSRFIGPLEAIIDRSPPRWIRVVFPFDSLGWITAVFQSWLRASSYFPVFVRAVGGAAGIEFVPPDLSRTTDEGDVLPVLEYVVETSWRFTVDWTYPTDNLARRESAETGDNVEIEANRGLLRIDELSESSVKE